MNTKFFLALFVCAAAVSCGKMDQPVVVEPIESEPVPNSYDIELSMSEGKMILDFVDAEGDLDLNAYVILKAEVKGKIRVDNKYKEVSDSLNVTNPYGGEIIHAVKGGSVEYDIHELYKTINEREYYEFTSNYKYLPFKPVWNEMIITAKLTFKRTYDQLLSDTTSAVFGQDWSTPNNLRDSVECQFSIRFTPDSQLPVASYTVVVNDNEI